MTAATNNIRRQLCHIRGTSDIRNFLILVPNFITVDEEKVLEQYVSPKLRRKRYEGDHWDSVISKYKETEISTIGDDHAVTKIVEGVQNFIKNIVGSSKMVLLPPHVVDLSADGYIGPHVDSIKFSGGIVAGLSLLSTRLMRLAPDHCDDNFRNAATSSELDSDKTPYYSLDSTPNDSPSNLDNIFVKQNLFTESTNFTDGCIEIILPPRSLYILSGPLRYSFTHEILGSKGASKLFDCNIVPERRLSVIFRDQLPS